MEGGNGHPDPDAQRIIRRARRSDLQHAIQLRQQQQQHNEQLDGINEAINLTLQQLGSLRLSVGNIMRQTTGTAPPNPDQEAERLSAELAAERQARRELENQVLDLQDELREAERLANQLTTVRNIWQSRFDELANGAAGPLNPATVYEIRNRPFVNNNNN
jgi:superfamily I DNA/RNA helicase